MEMFYIFKVRRNNAVWLIHQIYIIGKSGREEDKEVVGSDREIYDKVSCT